MHFQTFKWLFSIIHAPTFLVLLRHLNLPCKFSLISQCDTPAASLQLGESKIHLNNNFQVFSPATTRPVPFFRCQEFKCMKFFSGGGAICCPPSGDLRSWVISFSVVHFPGCTSPPRCLCQNLQTTETATLRLCISTDSYK